jgi:hypothetical protein
MVDLREIELHVDRHGRVDGHELEVLRRALYADGKIDRKEADFLVVLHKLRGEAREVNPEFEEFFREVMKLPPEQHTSGGKR